MSLNSPAGLQFTPLTRSPAQQCTCTNIDPTEDNDASITATTTEADNWPKLRVSTQNVAWDLLIATGCSAVAVIGVSVWCVARLRRVQLRAQTLLNPSSMMTQIHFDRRAEGSHVACMPLTVSYSSVPTVHQSLRLSLVCQPPDPPPYSAIDTDGQISSCTDPPPPYSSQELTHHA